MNSQPGGLFTAVLMLVPLVGVPVAAIVGIPPLPGSAIASVSEDGVEMEFANDPVEELGDLFAPVPSEPAVTVKSSVGHSTRTPNWTDPDPFDGDLVAEDLFSPFSEVEQTQEAGWGTADLAPAVSAFVGFDNQATPGHGIRANQAATMPVSATQQQGSQPSFGWEQAIDRLNSLGIRSYRLEEDMRRGGYHFYCLFSPANQPNVRHRFDATGATPMVAVIDALNQIDRWRSGR